MVSRSSCNCSPTSGNIGASRPASSSKATIRSQASRTTRAAAAAECGSNTSAPSAAHTPREQPSAIRAAATPSSAAGHAAWATAPGVKPVSLGDAACMADRVAASTSMAASNTAAFTYSLQPEPASSRTAPRATNSFSAASAPPETRSSAAATSAATTGNVCSANHASTPATASPASSAASSVRSPVESSRERRQRESSTRPPPMSITGEYDSTTAWSPAHSGSGSSRRTCTVRVSPTAMGASPSKSMMRPMTSAVPAITCTRAPDSSTRGLVPSRPR